MIILFKYCAKVENRESFRSFNYIYIYIDDDDDDDNNNNNNKNFKLIKPIFQVKRN